MAHNPISRDSVRVTPDLLPFLRFAAPLGADPLGFLGQGSPATSMSAAPKQYAMASSNSPVGANEAFTLACVITVSATLASGTQMLVDTTSGGGSGVRLFVSPPTLVCWTVDAAGDHVFVAAAPNYAVGQSHTIAMVHNPQSFEALYVDGTLQQSTADTRSWTMQSTFTIGRAPGGTSVWSGGLRDVYVFAKALTQDEVGVLERYLKV